ncbi:unnamed protein product [Candidula unifasciata]|uniref:Origin recognition complex subunit 4 n=1 Tax=Candidula unifasciata TaxID=100452 RepID=A0A8S3ZN76_9EUPU|nr:unnamed protein product [Candidula unifasciata]
MVKNNHQEDANSLRNHVKVSEITSHDRRSNLTPTKRTIATPSKFNSQIALSPSLLESRIASPRKHKLGISSPKKTPAKKRIAPSAAKPSLVDPDFNPLEETQRILRLRISQVNKPPVISGYEKERKQLYDLMKRTATTGESNSLLLIGPRGCGKSMLIQRVVEDLHSDVAVKENVQLVQLTGLLQTDDKLALREITRQLKLENTVGDRVFRSFAETLQFLIEALKKGDQASKPIVFILDEFDLFAQHKNQTLLYNLFDVSQSAQTPICVIGVTCRLDVVELLEKRVKSRFSHRQLYLFNKLTLSQYRDLCRSYLTLCSDFPDQDFADTWNKNIQCLLGEVSVKDILERQFSLTNDVRGLITLLTYPICQVNAAHPRVTAADVVTSFKLISTDTKSAMLHGVSTLELCLIIAMKHLTDIYDGEPFNFEMVYSEYQKFAQRRSGMQVYEKPVVMKAYEHLQTLELIKSHAGGGGAQVQKEYKLMSLLVHPSQILDAIQKYPGCPTEIKQWASQSIC